MAVRTPPVAPAASATAALVPHGSHAGKPSMPMGRPFTLVGSRQRAHLHLLSQSISKCHAIIINNGGTLYVRDLASREHVIINGKRVREADLKDGDLVRFGSFTFRFVDGVGKGRAPVRRPPDAALEMSGSSTPVMFDGRAIVIGRKPGCDVVLEEISVSTIHAAIFELDGRHYIRDLGSRTGTLVNDEPIHHQPLEINDRIRIGDTEMRYVPGNVLGNLDELEHLIGTASLGTETAELASDDAARAAAAAASQAIPLDSPDSEDAPIPLALDDDAIPIAEDAPVANAAPAKPALHEPVVATPDLAEIDLDSDPDISGSGDTAAIPLEPANETARTPVLSSRVVDPAEELDEAPAAPQEEAAAVAPEPHFGLDFWNEESEPADPAGETIRVAAADEHADNDFGLDLLPVEEHESPRQNVTESVLAVTAHEAISPAEPEALIEATTASTESVMSAPTEYQAVTEQPNVPASEIPGDSPEVAVEHTSETDLHFTAPPDVPSEHDSATVATPIEVPLNDATAPATDQAITQTPDDFDLLTGFAESPAAELPAPAPEADTFTEIGPLEQPAQEAPAAEQAASFDEALSGLSFDDEIGATNLAETSVPPIPVAPPPVAKAPPSVVADATPWPAQVADMRGKKGKAKAKKGGLSRFFSRRKKEEPEAAEEIAPAMPAAATPPAPVESEPDIPELEAQAANESVAPLEIHPAPSLDKHDSQSEEDARFEIAVAAHDADAPDLMPLASDEDLQPLDRRAAESRLENMGVPPMPSAGGVENPEKQGDSNLRVAGTGGTPVSHVDEAEIVARTDPSPESALDLDSYIDDSITEPPRDVDLDIDASDPSTSPADALSDTSFGRAVREFSGSASGALVEQTADPSPQPSATDFAATVPPGALPESPQEEPAEGIFDDERFGAGSHLSGPPEPTGDPIMDSAAAFLAHEDQAVEDQVSPSPESEAAAHEEPELTADLHRASDVLPPSSPAQTTPAEMEPAPAETDSAPIELEAAEVAPTPEPSHVGEQSAPEETISEFDRAFIAPEEPAPIDFDTPTERATISEAHDEIGFAFPATDEFPADADEAALVGDVQPAGTPETPVFTATPGLSESPVVDEIAPAPSAEVSQPQTLAEASEPQKPPAAAPPKIDPMFGMMRDFGSFLGGLPLSLPPVRKRAPTFGDVLVTPAAPAAEIAALTPEARIAEPVTAPPEETTEPSAPVEADATAEAAAPTPAFEPPPEFEALADEPPELFDAAPDELDALPDSLEEISDVTQAVGEPTTAPAPSADIFATTNAAALAPPEPVAEHPAPAAEPPAAKPEPAAPATAPTPESKAFAPTGKSKRALALTPPPRPKLPRASAVKPDDLPPAVALPELAAKSPAAHPGLIGMPPVFDVDIFSEMPVGFVTPTIPPVDDFLPKSSPAPRRRKRIEEPTVTPQDLSDLEQFEQTPFGQLPADALPVDEAPAAPRVAPPPRKKPRKFPFFFTMVVMTLTAAAATGIWYGLPVNANVKAAIHFDGLDKVSESARHEFFRLRIEQLRKGTRDQAREIYEAPDFRGRKGKGFLYPTGDDAVYQTILGKAYITPKGDALVFERNLTPDGEGDRLRFKALLKAIYVQAKPIGDAAATQKHQLALKKDELAGKAQEIARLKEQIQNEQSAQVKYTQALDEEKDLVDRSAFLEKIWRDATETARKLRADLETMQAAAPTPAAQPAPDADPGATELAGKLKGLTEALAAARGGNAGDAAKAAEAFDAALGQLQQEITNARASQKEGTPLFAYLTKAQQFDESLHQALAESAERQTASRQTLATLRRSLADKVEAHLKSAWGTDAELMKLEQDLQVKQHRLGAASGAGLSADADKLREEIAALDKSINARRDQVAAADASGDDIKGVQKIIADESDKLAREQARVDQRMADQLKALAAVAPKPDGLPADHRAVLDRLVQKVAAVSAARQQIAAGIPPTPAAADAGRIDKLEVQVAELQARLDVRQKQSADAAPGAPAPVQDTHATELTGKRTEVQTAERAAASALNEWAAVKKKLVDARGGLEKLKSASNTLIADNSALYRLQNEYNTKSRDIDRQTALTAGLIPQDPDRREDSVQVQPAQDMRPSMMGALAIFSAFITGWRFAHSGGESSAPFARVHGAPRRPRRLPAARPTSEPIAI